MSLLRQGREPVLLSFARSHGDLFHLQIHILNPQSDRFHNAQSAAIETIQREQPSLEIIGDSPRGAERLIVIKENVVIIDEYIVKLLHTLT